jgi:hypothetical protein
VIKLLMGGGASIVGWLFGTAGFIAVFATAATLGFQRWELHKAGLRGEGHMMCTIDYENAARANEREKAAAELALANKVAEDLRETERGLNDELERVTGEYQTLKADIAARPAADPDRCLSDSVLSKFGRAAAPAKVDGKREGAGGPYLGH